MENKKPITTFLKYALISYIAYAGVLFACKTFSSVKKKANTAFENIIEKAKDIGYPAGQDDNLKVKENKSYLENLIED